jgi:diketogulonate reductase-like aldo/keto reductase
MDLTSTVKLNNGVEIPWVGLGVFKSPPGKETEQAVRWALEIGYRHIDTAAFYENEADVGRALKDSGVPRETVFVTTKVWNTDLGYEQALKAFDRSREKLGLDVVDLYLVHWPVKGKYRETWKALEKLLADGKVRAIGVSNFLAHHLDDLRKASQVTPAVNPVIMEIARRYGKTPAQVILRWDLQLGVVTIPKSIHRERILENSKVFDFELAHDDVSRISALDTGTRIGPNPDNITF